MKKRTRQRLTRVLTAIPAPVLAWWLLQATGVWSSGASPSHFFLFLFCVLGVDRILSAAIDLVTIALAPTATIEHRH
jgi:hypothetical protein